VPDAIDAADENGVLARATLGGNIRATFATHFQTIGVQLGARYEGSAVIAPDGITSPVDLPDQYQPSAAPGGRAPHVDLAGTGPLFDRFGIGFTLLKTNGAATASIEWAAAKRRVPLKVLDLDDPRGVLAYDRAMTLIRPDQHVAWRGDTAPDDPIGLIDRVRGAS
jgi:hypothetical protein